MLWITWLFACKYPKHTTLTTLNEYYQKQTLNVHLNHALCYMKSLAPRLWNWFTAPALASEVLADDMGLDGYRVMHGKGKESSYLPSQSCATDMKLNLTGDLEIKINSVSGWLGHLTSSVLDKIRSVIYSTDLAFSKGTKKMSECGWLWQIQNIPAPAQSLSQSKQEKTDSWSLIQTTSCHRPLRRQDGKKTDK